MKEIHDNDPELSCFNYVISLITICGKDIETEDC